MITTFKIMTGRVRLVKSKLFNLRENNITRGHRYKIVKQTRHIIYETINILQ